MTRWVIHREDCPALCNYRHRAKGCLVMRHPNHTCSCNPPSPEALAELVDAAKIHIYTDAWENWHPARGQGERETLAATRLDAALKPFTKE